MGFEGHFKSWIMSLGVRWDLKGILSSGVYPIVSGGI
jgi:hypothetical protein